MLDQGEQQAEELAVYVNFGSSLHCNRVQSLEGKLWRLDFPGITVSGQAEQEKKACEDFGNNEMVCHLG